MKLKGKSAERVRGIEGEALEKLIFKNLRFRLTEKHRILFINLFRSGYWQGEDRSMERIGDLLPKHYVELNIQPLDPQAGEALIANLLNIIDEGAITRSGGSFEVTDKINSVVVPPTINDVLIARIDRLEEQTRELVKTAAVIGRSFFDRIIRDVAASVEGLDHRLGYLKDTQLIRDRVRMEELEYFFKHALAQEAAYESTLLQQRKALHLKVAKSIEKVFQERLHEFYGLLAFH